MLAGDVGPPGPRRARGGRHGEPAARAGAGPARAVPSAPRHGRRVVRAARRTVRPHGAAEYARLRQQRHLYGARVPKPVSGHDF